MGSLRLLRLANVYIVASAVLLAVGALFVARDRALAVSAGGALMSANFWFLRILVLRTMMPGGARALYGVGIMLKFFLVMAAMAFLLLGAKLDGLGVMVGLCSLLSGIAAAVIHMIITTKPEGASVGA